jgi:glucose-6-phosphate-specific signal transduction histidine kinase
VLFRFFEQTLEILGRAGSGSAVEAALGGGESCVSLRLGRDGEASAQALQEWMQSLACAAIRERVRALGGNLEFEVNGSGVCTATLPLARATAGDGNPRLS